MSSSLNRREFLALSAGAPLSLSKAGTTEQSPQASRPSGSPNWVKQGIVAASNMESLCFVRRRGGDDVNYAEELRAEHSDATVRTLLDQGVNLLILQFYMGAGLKAEAHDIATASEFVNVAHSRGLRISAYVGGTLLYETLEAEQPRSKDWKQIDEFGKPIYYVEPGQTFRYMACRNNPDYLAYIKQVLKMAVHDVGVDMIHFDQMLWPPTSCHCSSCRDQFRQFLKRRYSGDLALIRFGFDDVALLDIPPFGNNSGQNWFAELTNPLTQEWELFRAWSLAERFKELTDYIRKLNPQTAVLGVPVLNLEDNIGFSYGVDYSQLLDGCDTVFSEEPNQPVMWTDDSRLVSQIRTYKGVRSMGKSLWVWQTLTREDESPGWGDDAMERGLSEALAYNDRNLGVVAGLDIGSNTIPEAAKPYVDLFSKRSKELTNTKTVADAAILRTFASSTFVPTRANVSTTLLEQSLIVAKIPFAIIFDRHLHHLSDYKVLVIADQEALSDAQVTAIREFVHKGGGLVATGRSSLFNEWLLKRPTFALSELLGISKPVYEANAPRRVELGSGRVVYVPRVEPAIEPPAPQLAYSFPNHYWHLPKNHEELVNSIRWAAHDRLSVEVNAPEWITVELARQGGELLLLHLVNYKHKTTVTDIRVTIRLDANSQLSEAVLVTPENVVGKKLPTLSVSGGASLTIPSMRVYALVLMRV